MVYKFECSKTGMDCSFTAEAPSKEELMGKIAAHAKEAHQLETLPPEMMEKVNGAITEVQEEAQPSAAPENGSGDQS